ncbi:MAG: hypothetical protein MZV63_52900 [Marinilabiliales bacterium]|nr:hypothetical protein [Marinilabiliales bacterium]
MTRYGDVMMPQMIVADTRTFGKKIKIDITFYSSACLRPLARHWAKKNR